MTDWNFRCACGCEWHDSKLLKSCGLKHKSPCVDLQCDKRLQDGRVVPTKLYRERFTNTLVARWNRDSDTMQPCRICLRPAFKVIPPDGVPRPVECDGCWEVTTRLEGFLRDGGEIAERILIDALKASGRVQYVRVLVRKDSE